MVVTRPLLSLLVFMTMILLGRSDFASDKAECTNQLMGLATCLTFVQGSAKAPTPDCCTGFEQVTGKSLKCLCILIQDRNQPELGIKFNVTLALELPKRCNVPATVSDCPKLLKLPKDSQETKMFEQFVKQMNEYDSPSANSTSSSVKGTSTAAVSTTAPKGTETQSNGVKSEKWIASIYFILPVFFLLRV